MDDEQIRKINVDRLWIWGENLVGYHSMPVLLVGIGHDDHAGEVHIMTLEAMDDASIIVILLAAYDKLILRR